MISKFIKKCISIGSIISIFMCCSSFANNHNFDRSLIQNNLKRTVSEIKNQFQINAISLAVILPGENKPFVINNGTVKICSKKISKNNLFQIGSITKTFTAEIAAKMIENKKLRLFDKVGQYLPQYKKWKSITIEQLINQTSGIPDYDASPNWWTNLVKNPDRIWKSNELINIAYRMHKSFKPGAGWDYSNTNYVLLGMILDKIQNRKSPKVMMDQIFQEARLDNTYYLTKKYPQEILRRMVHGYYRKYDQTNINTSWLQSAGANVSNPNQIASWYYFLFNIENRTGLPITRFTSFVKTNDGEKTNNIYETGYSFGIFRMNTPQGLIYFTPGLTPGYTSMVVYAPCLNTYFSYSTSSGLLKGFHKTMLMSIMKILNQEISRNSISTPKYCHNWKYRQQFIFPKI